LHINDNIKKARLLRNFSQDDVAGKLAVKRSTFAEWENKTIPRADVFWRLAAVLSVSPDDLLTEGWEPDDNPSYAPTTKLQKISLETIQMDLDNLLRHQVAARAEIRAYGQYQVTRDSKGDQNQIVRILGEIGMLVAEHEESILKEGRIDGAGK
jgi:transcriptional regulator with XRE-family HTH domain